MEKCELCKNPVFLRVDTYVQGTCDLKYQITPSESGPWLGPYDFKLCVELLWKIKSYFQIDRNQNFGKTAASVFLVEE